MYIVEPLLKQRLLCITAIGEAVPLARAVTCRGIGVTRNRHARCRGNNISDTIRLQLL